MTQRRTRLVKNNDGASTYISYTARVQTKCAESPFHCVTVYVDTQRKYYFHKPCMEKKGRMHDQALFSSPALITAWLGCYIAIHMRTFSSPHNFSYA